MAKNVLYCILQINGILSIRFLFLHPSYGQGQPDLLNSSCWSQYPRVKQAKALEAVLGPGDMLYLPPMWWHYVEALDLSISVNVWSQSADSDIMRNVMELVHEIIVEGSKLELFQDEMNKRWMAAFLIHKVLATTLPPQASSGKLTQPVTDFINQLIDARYQPLFQIHELSYQFPSGNLHYCPILDITPLPFLLPTNFLTIQVESAAKKIAGLFKELSANSRDIWIGNFVENVAYWATETELVAAFLYNCLSK